MKNTKAVTVGTARGNKTLTIGQLVAVDGEQTTIIGFGEKRGCLVVDFSNGEWRYAYEVAR